MKICTFLGHQHCPASIRPLIVKQVETLIEQENVTFFYVGYQGQFNDIVRNVLRDLSIVYPEICYRVIVSYATWQKNYEDLTDARIIETTMDLLPRYNREYCERWMLRQADIVVTYITHSQDFAAKLVEQAKRQGKTIIHLAEL